MEKAWNDLKMEWQPSGEFNGTNLSPLARTVSWQIFIFLVKDKIDRIPRSIEKPTHDEALIEDVVWAVRDEQLNRLDVLDNSTEQEWFDVIMLFVQHERDRKKFIEAAEKNERCEMPQGFMDSQDFSVPNYPKEVSLVLR